ATRNVESPRDVQSFWNFVEQSSTRGFEFMLEDPVAANLMQCLQREQSLLAELRSSDLLESIDEFYAELTRRGQELGAVRVDLPAELLVALVRDLAMTFDRWFITARAGAANGKPGPSPAAAARAFTDTAQRLCRPTRAAHAQLPSSDTIP
ncbi:MAG TPA: hypothetical protein VFQ61_10645, partial [Polyangiaceae bacterium]|nr:hypothetical protein [Polyangiaceae bacterium]